MILLISFVGLFISLLLGIAYLNAQSETAQGAALTAAILIAVVVVATWFYPAPNDQKVVEDKPYDTIPIASFANAQEIEGTPGGFLSSGSIDEKTVYRYVEAHEGGSYTLEQLDLPESGNRITKGKDHKPVSGVVIYEDSKAEDARIEFRKCRHTDQIAKFLRDDTCGDLIEFHVPEGSIIRDFSLDAGNGRETG